MYCISNIESSWCSRCSVLGILCVLQWVFFFFAKSTCIYYESQLYKFIREQFIAKFPDREPRMKSSISRLIRKLEIWGRALNTSYGGAPFVLTRAFSNLVCYIDCRLINERGGGSFWVFNVKRIKMIFFS